MPAPRKRGNAACPCKCGQPAVKTSRTRRLSCRMCEYTARVSRAMIVRGLPGCPCGAVLEPDCLEDRCLVPGDYGAAAWAELEGKRVYGEIQGDRARVGHRRRAFRAELAAMDDRERAYVLAKTGVLEGYMRRRSPAAAAEARKLLEGDGIPF